MDISPTRSLPPLVCISIPLDTRDDTADMVIAIENCAVSADTPPAYMAVAILALKDYLKRVVFDNVNLKGKLGIADHSITYNGSINIHWTLLKGNMSKVRMSINTFIRKFKPNKIKHEFQAHMRNIFNVSTNNAQFNHCVKAIAKARSAMTTTLLGNITVKPEKFRDLKNSIIDFPAITVSDNVEAPAPCRFTTPLPTIAVRGPMSIYAWLFLMEHARATLCGGKLFCRANITQVRNYISPRNVEHFVRLTLDRLRAGKAAESAHMALRDGQIDAKTAQMLMSQDPSNSVITTYLERLTV